MILPATARPNSIGLRHPPLQIQVISIAMAGGSEEMELAATSAASESAAAPAVAAAPEQEQEQQRPTEGAGAGAVAAAAAVVAVAGQGEGGGEGEPLRLMVNGFNKFMNKNQVAKLLAQAGVEYEGLKRPQNTFVAVLTFKDLAQREGAQAKLKGVKCRGRELRWQVAAQQDWGLGRNQQQRQGQGQQEGGEEAPRPRKTLDETVTPLLGLPYAEQLGKKEGEMREGCVQRMFRDIKAAYHDKRRKLAKAQQKGEGGEDPKAFSIPPWVFQGVGGCATEPIRASPATEAYRNKSEFTVGLDAEGVPTVGFRIGTYKEGSVLVHDVANCSALLDATSKTVAAALQEYIRLPGASPPYDTIHHTGVWRTVTVRTSQRTGQCLVIVVAAPKGLPEGQSWADEQARLVGWLTAPIKPADPSSAMVAGAGDGEGKTWTGITGLYIWPYDGWSNPVSGQDPLVHAWGQTHMEEELLGLRFRISPDAFFQTNTAAAEVLYQAVIDECKLQEQQQHSQTGAGGVILDVCCGTGTIGICAAVQLSEGEARGVKRKAEDEEGGTAADAGQEGGKGSGSGKLVLGVELCPTAVEDARVNAARNGVGNAVFVCAKAEDVLGGALAAEGFGGGGGGSAVGEALQRATAEGNQSLIAIVDPPRAGLHNDCLRALRNSKKVEHVIYVSCNPTKSLCKDASMLCGPRSQKFHGEAFRPVKAIPVDMFPHTEHCEMVVVFSRESVVAGEGEAAAGQRG